jgi:hypothetical protein
VFTDREGQQTNILFAPIKNLSNPPGPGTAPNWSRHGGLVAVVAGMVTIPE